MTEDFRRRSLIVNDRVEEYDGTTAVVRTAHLEADEIEFLRWRAERWMKLRHLPDVLRLYPGFVLRHMPVMCAHTFRGSTWRSALGLESERRGIPALQAAAGAVNANTCRRCLLTNAVAHSRADDCLTASLNLPYLADAAGGASHSS